MKKRMWVGVLLVILCTSTLLTACEWSPDDANKVIDNALDKLGNGASIEGAFSQFQNINVASSYLGYGYDVINSPYMNVKYINPTAILDSEKLANSKLRLVKINSSDLTSAEGTTMEEFIEECNAKFSLYGKAGKMFSGGISLSFNGSTEAQSYYYFSKSTYSVHKFNIFLTNSVEDLRDMLTEEFRRDLENMSAGFLFAKYGTHMIKEAAMGGRIEVDSVYSSSTATSSMQIQADVNAHIKATSASSVNIESSAEYDRKLQENNISVRTNVHQVGGKLIDNSLNALAENFKVWAASFDEDLDNSVLSGVVGASSLVGLWELLPDNLVERRLELEKTFVELLDEKYEKVCSQFQIDTDKSLTLSKVGNGEISNVKEIYQIGEKVQLSATPAEGSVFDGWYENDQLVSSDPNYSFAIYSNRNFVAKFVDKDACFVKIQLERTLCKLDTGFNTTLNPDDVENAQNRHNGFEIGEVILSGCLRNSDNTYRIVADNISFTYKLLVDINGIPTVTSEKKHYIYSDTYNGTIIGTNISGTKIGRGAYYAKVVYKDGSTSETGVTNFMDGAEAFAEIPLSVDLISQKPLESIDRIEIDVFYENNYVWKNWLGQWTENHFYNWRCSTVIKFN